MADAAAKRFSGVRGSVDSGVLMAALRELGFGTGSTMATLTQKEARARACSPALLWTCFYAAFTLAHVTRKCTMHACLTTCVRAHTCTRYVGYMAMKTHKQSAFNTL
eukprot:5650003-Pleurochrysis_carterae.AAC.2